MECLLVLATNVCLVWFCFVKVCVDFWTGVKILVQKRKFVKTFLIDQTKIILVCFCSSTLQECLELHINRILWISWSISFFEPNALSHLVPLELNLVPCFRHNVLDIKKFGSISFYIGQSLGMKASLGLEWRSSALTTTWGRLSTPISNVHNNPRNKKKGKQNKQTKKML
jgi:hypothetical protein